uniref:Protein TIC 20 n=1 Tax=Ananas comosus var. bracteatus TaxID=296719 RepID=A0A6V7PRM6_ANACO|nr:unnamed protein product [Ananas comosus var. bracteatus]
MLNAYPSHLQCLPSPWSSCHRRITVYIGAMLCNVMLHYPYGPDCTREDAVIPAAVAISALAVDGARRRFETLAPSRSRDLHRRAAADAVSGREAPNPYTSPLCDYQATLQGTLLIMYATQCSTVGSLGIDVPHQGGILATLQGTLLVMYAAHRSTVGHLRINLPPRRVNRRPPPVYIPVRNSTAPLKFSGLCASHREIKVSSVRGEPRFGSFSNFSLAGENSISGIPSLSRRSKMRPRSSVVPLASKSSFSYPEMTCKPKWWWRTLACIPYLLPLHNIWSYADVVYHLHPLLQNYEFLVNPFLDTIALMPSWLTYALFMGIYYFVVRRNELPHFLRFHIAMAMLFDTGIQIMGTVCTWMPNTVYRGSLMVHFWLALAFLQMYTVLDCMRCALSGMYSEVPFLSESAYIHTDLKLF